MAVLRDSVDLGHEFVQQPVYLFLKFGGHRTAPVPRSIMHHYFKHLCFILQDVSSLGGYKWALAVTKDIQVYGADTVEFKPVRSLPRTSNKPVYKHQPLS
jgi:hypothetical protein